MVPDCVSSFPSVTPVASSEMMTGTGPAGHWVMGMNWYHRIERRYIEYGSSFEATRTFGLFRAMYDLVYNMNLDHLSWQAETVFERLGDAGVRTATTPFLIYRGRHRHELGLEGLAKRAAAAANFRHAVWGPDEFFYGDIYASRPTGCGPSFTRPGTRDEYSACVGEELVREGAYDFLLYSLPDNDFHSHRHGPDATLESIAKADAMFARIVEAGGGLDAFLSEHAVVLTADHAQTRGGARPAAGRRAGRGLGGAPAEHRPSRGRRDRGQPDLARRCRLHPRRRVPASGHPRARPPPPPRARRSRPGRPGWRRSDGTPVRRAGVGLDDPAALDAVVERNGYEFRFRPGGQLRDVRGNGWAVSGEPEALAGDITRGRFESHEYPDGLARLWSALTSPHAGDILISAAEGYECVDWGGVSHAGGGSHGSLGRGDSLAPVVFVGCGPDAPEKRPQWALRDLAPVILEHFGVDAGRPQG